MHSTKSASWRVLLIAPLLSVIFIAGAAQGQLRVVTYNIAQLRGDTNALQEVVEALMVDDQPGFAAPVSVFLFQEVRNSDLPVLQNIIAAAAPPGVLYATGTYTNINRDPTGGAQAMFYRAGFLFEDQAEHLDIFTGGGRYSDRWRLRLLGYDSPQAGFYIYSSHLKASDTPADRLERLAGVQAIRDDADSLPAGTHVIYAGDMNFYNNSEPGYLEFLSAGIGQAVDPLGTANWTGLANAINHTQSPRLINAGGLAGGGMDDRFDFQLSNIEFHDDQGLSMIPGTYRAFGNDGQHYNQAINNGNNFYYPADVARSNALADALHDASDHIPVVVDYRIPARMAANINPANFGTVIEGANVSINYFVQNTAPSVTTALGADILEYTATGTGVVDDQSFGQVLALTPQFGSLSIDTSIAGPASGSVEFTSSNEAVQNGLIVRDVSGMILRASRPSFSESQDLTELTVPVAFDFESGIHEIQIPVFNFNFDSLQALMDIDSIDGVAPPLSYVAGLGSDVGPSPATLIFDFDTTGLADGQYDSVLTIHTSDENLPGAGASQIVLTLNVTVGEVPDCPADLNGDGNVNVADMLIVLNSWGACPGCPADLTGSGTVSVGDLLIVLSAWGGCP